MIIIGLAGQAGVGKDTIADYLVQRYGFVKFAFSDALYNEVQLGFGLPDQAMLRDRAKKEVLTERLAIENCLDFEFRKVMRAKLSPLERYQVSPRHILQWWGTDYRRAQDPDYWLYQAANALWDHQELAPYPEQRQQYFVECGTRFENERSWIKNGGETGTTNPCLWLGNIWHVHRAGVEPNDPHSSAAPLPVLPGEREIFNNDTAERLCQGVDLLLSTGARFVKVEPMVRAEDLPQISEEDQRHGEVLRAMRNANAPGLGE